MNLYSPVVLGLVTTQILVILTFKNHNVRPALSSCQGVNFSGHIPHLTLGVIILLKMLTQPKTVENSLYSS